jgi:hypothetical protein
MSQCGPVRTTTGYWGAPPIPPDRVYYEGDPGDLDDEETPNRVPTITGAQGAAAICPGGLRDRAGFGEG